MNESILRALMKLFALAASAKQEDVSQNSRTIVESFLKQKLNNSFVLEYLTLFDEYLFGYQKRSKGNTEKKRKSSSLSSVKILGICQEINEQLQQKEKIIVLVRLLEFIKTSSVISEYETDLLKGVADTFNIPKNEFQNVKAFVIDGVEEIVDSKSVLLIKAEENSSSPVMHLQKENLNGEIIVLHIDSTNTFILKYVGKDGLSLNTQHIIPERTYFFDHGAILKGNRISPIYYTDISSRFINEEGAARIVFTANDVEFRFKGSDTGIHKLRFSEESGHLIGVMGGSGVGKSTLLSVLIGTIPINSGKISINGYDLHADKDELKGVIGFVPQDDLLIEELTVFQNLYYNAKLCFGGLNQDEINRIVEQVLLDLDLIAIKHLTVGDSLNKFISGGQRKRLNIALELMREPSILIVDEPTSGLSSQDSEMVMSLLKEQTLKGKLVMVNIHQPSSDIYKLLDRLLMLDKGGYPVYWGNPVDAVVYFKTASGQLNALESECESCGNVNPEQPLQILEGKVVNEYGKFTRDRKVTPQEWNKLFLENIGDKIALPKISEKLPLPKNLFKTPNGFTQFKIFSIRNLLSKLTNKQYLLINFLEAPALALILGIFTKYFSGRIGDSGAYVFSKNENIPAYLFMSVIVALFIGLTVSAEEIIRDRKILKREAFLNLSWVSYLNSKIVVLFALGAVQCLSFVLVGNFILGIKWMTLSYFLVLFSTIASAILIGLNLSSALNSVVTIYITIPFILVPQLLFSGVIVNFGKIHKTFAAVEHVPFIGETMISRWAYEALAVNQFKNNAFEKHFFLTEKKKSDASFQTMFRLPELQSRIDRSLKNITFGGTTAQLDDDLQLLFNEFERLERAVPTLGFPQLAELNRNRFSDEVAESATMYIEELTVHFSDIQKVAREEKAEKLSELSEKLGGPKALALYKEEHHNLRLEELVMNRNESKQLVETEDHYLIQAKDPIFQTPTSNFGRAHFYAAEKLVFGKKIDTLWFNIMFIWIAVLGMYILLLFNGTKKLVDTLSRIKLPSFREKK